MKKILLVIVALLFVSVDASENPFEVKKNVKIIEQGESSLLSELHVIAEKQEAAEDAKDEDEEEEEVGNENPTQEETLKVNTETAEDKAIEKESENIVEDVDLKIEEERLTKIKEDQALLEEARVKQEQEKVALEKLAAEKLEQQKVFAVEEAELARLEAEKAKLEKQLAAEEVEQKKRESEVHTQEQVDTVATQEKEVGVTSGDINISKEAADASKAADAEFKEAMKMMDE